MPWRMPARPAAVIVGQKGERARDEQRLAPFRPVRALSFAAFQ